MAPRDPDTTIKRLIVGVWGVLVILASAVAVVACIRATVVHGESPVMITGVVGGLMGVVAGLFFVRLGIRGNARL